MPKINTCLKGANSQLIALDARWKGEALPSELVLFIHGYKGFKDWGGWNQMADHLANSTTAVLKFNFSHSGIGEEDLTDFSRLDLFQQNNYSLEVEDVGHVLNWVKNQTEFQNIEKIHLIGHSRGGGIAVLAAAKYSDISSLITLASVCDYSLRFPMNKELEDWKKSGLSYVVNGRTGQKMPHGIQFYNNFTENKDALDIEAKIKSLSIPVLIIHANDDQAVHIEEALKIKKWNPKAELVRLDSGGHTFGLKHPWNEADLPQALLKVLEEINVFLS